MNSSRAPGEFYVYPASPDPAPYFRIRIIDGVLKTDGAIDCRLGHVQAASGARDDPFAYWHWTGKELHIENDRYGFYPFFYYSGQSEFIISPSLVRLLELGVPPDLDWPALATFLRLDSFLGQDTAFRYIRVVPPNATVTMQNNLPVVSGSRFISKPDWHIQRDAAMDGFIELVRRAIRCRLAENTVVPLSGGRDSRHIFLELCESGAPPQAAITVRYDRGRTSEDLFAAQQLTQAAGVPHIIVDIPADRISLEWRKNIETHLCTLEHAWLLPMADYIQGRHGAVYEGLAGELLSTSFLNTYERQRWIETGQHERLAGSLLNEGYLPNLLRPELYKLASRDIAISRLVEELRTHESAANPFGSFLFWNRARRVTALPPTVLLGTRAPTWCPYIDRDVVDFMTRLPVGLLIAKEYHQFHTDTIRRAYPRYAEISYAGKWRKHRPLSYHLWFLRGLLRVVAQESRSTLLKRSFLATRLARCVALPRYLPEVSMLARPAVYLLQLEHYTARP